MLENQPDSHNPAAPNGGSPKSPRIIVGIGDAVAKVERDEFDRRSAGGAPHTEPIVAAIRSGNLTFVLVPRGTRYRSLPDNVTGKPLLFILGDDLDTSKGPGAFDTKTLKRVFGGAARVVVHAAKAEPGHYAAAVAAAQRHGKAVVIECQPHTETAWLATAVKYAPGAGVLVIIPNSARYQAHGRGA